METMHEEEALRLVLTDPKLAFVIGNFNSREELRKGLYWPEPADRPRYARHDWIDGAFAASMLPAEVKKEFGNLADSKGKRKMREPKF